MGLQRVSSGLLVARRDVSELGYAEARRSRGSEQGSEVVRSAPAGARVGEEFAQQRDRTQRRGLHLGGRHTAGR